jgi:sulfatase modifying factor 1
MLRRKGSFLLIALAWAAVGVSRADVFDMGGSRNADGTWTGLASLEIATVGNAGNPGDTRYPSGSITSFGGVSYVYAIGRFTVTAAQYTEFLNAVAATDTYALYNTQMSSPTVAGCKIWRMGSAGSYAYHVALEDANRPVNFVSWGDAARFANWLHNGQPVGEQTLNTTEDGAYYLNGATSNAALQAVVRKPEARWAIPTEDEWYKAAYHKNDGPTANYWDYATAGNDLPSNALVDPDPGNNANFYQNGYTLGSPHWRTQVGEFEDSASAYGTFDQAGNVWEWNEAVIGVSRGLRGGSYLFSAADYLHASSRVNSSSPSGENVAYGFRLVHIPDEQGLVGDLNCDGAIDTADIDGFVLALVDPAHYAAMFPHCDYMLADCNGDGAVDTADIDSFVMLIVGG